MAGHTFQPPEPDDDHFLKLVTLTVIVYDKTSPLSYVYDREGNSSAIRIEKRTHYAILLHAQSESENARHFANSAKCIPYKFANCIFKPIEITLYQGKWSSIQGGLRIKHCWCYLLKSPTNWQRPPTFYEKIIYCKNEHRMFDKYFCF